VGRGQTYLTKFLIKFGGRSLPNLNTIKIIEIF
jgi:hypothetical protein